MTPEEVSACIAYANGIDPRVQMTVPNSQLWARVLGRKTSNEVMAGIQIYYERGRVNGREHPAVDPTSVRRIINESYEREEARQRALEPPKGKARNPLSFRQRNPAEWDRLFRQSAEERRDDLTSRGIPVDPPAHLKEGES
ncbi:hypothetical protein [Glutamicibacter protophormiae]|uniref:hypothetical protein n=1 Tax=Glutamicibacter protophormiae TaxID=37930 RepID=UPI003A930BF7